MPGTTKTTSCADVIQVVVQPAVRGEICASDEHENEREM